GARTPARRGVPDSPVIAAARKRLAPAVAAVRERGWALETTDHLRDRLSELVHDLEIELGTGDWDAAGHATALRRAMAEVGQAFDLADALPAAIDPDATYRPSSINAPVFDADGTAAVVLCLIDHTGPLPGAEVLALGDHLRETARQVTAALHGHPPTTPGQRSAGG
ncbi:MAG: hypothetical protein HOV68_31210, partial [Streptomycetaceae bacterium]|nr:hypothetical protein [Streptomycetaceae bacterium]